MNDGNALYVIFDLDGTLANNEHRQHFLSTSPKQWDAFFEAMNKDEPNANIVELYKTLVASKAYEVIIFTARPERYRSATLAWLQKFSIPCTSMYMRRDGDYRADAEIKAEMLKLLGIEPSNVAFIVDDRAQVVRMWRDLGITCLQCADHNF